MYKRNSPDKIEANKGCVREKNKKETKKSSKHGMCNRNSPDKKKKKKKSQHGMCKRNSQHTNEASSGCVRGTLRIQMKPARDV